MLFNSVLYLVFLAAAVGVSWALVRHAAWRMLFLFLMSCWFYMAYEPRFIFLILGSTVYDFTIAQLLDRTPDSQPTKRKLLLAASVGVNLSLLCYFKYLNFFVQSAVQAAQAVGLGWTAPIWDIALPVGISFYTFQTMSYNIDVYRREVPAEKNLLRFALFSTFFPQLVAGPIVRPHHFLPQLHRTPTLTVDDVSYALFRICKGLFKKVVVADYLAVNLVDRVFSQPSLYSGAEVLVGLYAYTMQIYCDFSGYSDIAIGSARLLGYHLPENFLRPYAARTVAEFWRKWHMTLSTWLRHYVFFPLGGSRGSVWIAHRNSMITLVLIGLWHGANWTFVVYGVLHGLAIAVNRTLHRSRPKDFDEDNQPWHQNLWKIAVTLHFVVLARILFRAPSLTAAGEVWQALWSNGWGLGRIDALTAWVLLGAFAVHFTPVRWLDDARSRFAALPGLAQGGVLAGVAVVMAAMAEKDVVPFIYFQF